MNRLSTLFVLSFSLVALAGPREDAVSQALDAVTDAQDEAEDATGSCKRSLKQLDALGDKLSSLKKDATDKGLTRAKELAEDLSDAAREDCKGSLAKRVRKSLGKAVGHLERAQEEKVASASAPAGNGTQQGANVLVNLAGGIGALFGGAQSKTSTNKTETSSSRRTEEINGKPIDGDDDESPAPRKNAKKEAPSRGGFQATCSKNADCDSNTCFVGKGNLGYCTKMCNSFSDCPSFWECKRAANAPQNICMQDD
ncbi:MAG: hypothetical protein Q8N23_30135 [Archangium sp.]|nr:hypothetical protein [Archangium sp.]MDP3156969.1 hypothetical protein [Archangium sp.]MDP3575649.1 hypothetical protein [Archangium sp.]